MIKKNSPDTSSHINIEMCDNDFLKWSHEMSSSVTVYFILVRLVTQISVCVTVRNTACVTKASFCTSEVYIGIGVKVGLFRV